MRGINAVSITALFLNSFGFSKKKPETDQATVREIMDRLEGLYGQIRGPMKISCYRALPLDRPVVYTFLLDSTVVAADALAEYLRI